MREFRIKPDGLKETRKRSLIILIPFFLLAIGAAVAIAAMQDKDKKNTAPTLPLILPIVALSAGVGMYRGMNRQQKLYESYTLTLTENVVMREQLNTPPVTLYFKDITEIVRAKNGAFTLRGKDPADVIIIPSQIDGHLELEKTLRDIAPIAMKSKKSTLEKYMAALPLLAIGLLFSVYTATNKLVVAITGTMVIALMLWSFFEVQRSRNTDSKTKRNLWWVWIVLISVAGVMITKLSSTTP